MRYLKVIVQDRSENDRADTVKLRFFQRDPDLPDELMHEAVAFDATADGAVDVQICGDIDFDGASTFKDRRLLKMFANHALKLSWFNKGNAGSRSVNLYVTRHDQWDKPLEVRSDFNQHNSSGVGEVLMHSTTVFDQKTECHSAPPEQGDQFELFDTVDQQTIQTLSQLYLRFNWY